MAVIKCPECHKEMSDIAEKCPNCGYPYAEKVALYHKAVDLMAECESETSFLGVAEIFSSISEICEAQELEKHCRLKSKAESKKAEISHLNHEKVLLERELSKKRLIINSIFMGLGISLVLTVLLTELALKIYSYMPFIAMVCTMLIPTLILLPIFFRIISNGKSHKQRQNKLKALCKQIEEIENELTVL